MSRSKSIIAGIIVIAALLMVAVGVLATDHTNPPVTYDITWDSPKTEALARKPPLPVKAAGAVSVLGRAPTQRATASRISSRLRHSLRQRGAANPTAITTATMTNGALV